MKITPKRLKRIKALHKKGKSERQIARAIGCSRSTVWQWLNK